MECGSHAAAFILAAMLPGRGEPTRGSARLSDRGWTSSYAEHGSAIPPRRRDGSMAAALHGSAAPNEDMATVQSWLMFLIQEFQWSLSLIVDFFCPWWYTSQTLKCPRSFPIGC